MELQTPTPGEKTEKSELGKMGDLLAKVGFQPPKAITDPTGLSFSFSPAHPKEGVTIPSLLVKPDGTVKDIRIDQDSWNGQKTTKLVDLFATHQINCYESGEAPYTNLIFEERRPVTQPQVGLQVLTIYPKRTPNRPVTYRQRLVTL